MTTTATPAPEPEATPSPVSAVCPHCGMDPVEIAIFTQVVTIGGGALAIASIFCSNVKCRKLFNAQIVGGEPNVQQPNAGRRIVAPS